MEGFVDPRSDPTPNEQRRASVTSSDPERLEPLHLACREGRLYDVERWIASGHPLQLAETAEVPRRRHTTALGIALEQRNHALTLLLLCNGYDPDAEPYGALDVALESRRVDLVDLLLVWGADAHRVDRSVLFETYDSALFARFYGLGVDLTERHALARALGYHSEADYEWGAKRLSRSRVSAR